MFYDCHVHSSFSHDCNEPIENSIKSAISLGLKEITFTDHLDLDFPDPNGCALLDFENYFKELSIMREKYEKEIIIKSGIEIGLQPQIKSEIEQIVNKYPFDFIIGSIHAGDYLDFYNGDFFIGKKQKYAYARYFEICLENINIFKGCFDVFGHLDYIARYGNFEKKVLNPDDFGDIIDEILKTLIKNKQGIEINSSGFRYNLNVFHPKESILKKYKNLGGEIITLGSDSHISSTLTQDFDKIIKTLDELGIEKVSSFSKRIHSFVSLREFFG